MKEETKEALKELLKYIGIPLLLVILFCTYDDGTDFSAGDVWRAEEKAREEGYNAGYEEGYDKGYDKGHEDGYYAGYKNINIGTINSEEENMFDEYNENEKLVDYVGPEDDDDSGDEGGFSVSESERFFIKSNIADKEAIIKALEENNDDGKYDDTISKIENQIDGLKRFLGE